MAIIYTYTYIVGSHSVYVLQILKVYASALHAHHSSYHTVVA